MAIDKAITDLPVAETVGNDDLFVLEQGNTAKAVTGETIKTFIGAGSGISNEAKQALLSLLEKVAYTDDQGQTYLDALEAALYPPVDLVSISAVFTQESAVIYDTDDLDVLRQYLTVTATYSDSTTGVVTTYTLSGVLAAGTSTITVSYGGKTTTFTVTVTHKQAYITNGLIHHWDGIDNTGNGHSGSATTWADLVGDANLVISGNYTSWLENALSFSSSLKDYVYANALDEESACTLEACFESTGNKSTVVVMINPASGTGSRNARQVTLFTDNTVGGVGASGKTYSNTESVIADIRTVSIDYTNKTVNHLYINASEASLSNQTHSFQYAGSKQMYVGGVDATYPFTGKVYSIRIYNRALTAEEIANNYAVDVERFGLE